MSKQANDSTTTADARAFACKKVWEQDAPVLHVSHDADGDWQFQCGGDEHNSADQAVLIHVSHMFDLWAELQVVADLAAGSYAWRTSTTKPWKRYKNP